MDSKIFFDNKKYLSSKEAGKLSGYTHDYISRMARQGKIEGRQFGRAWYVDEDSLSDFVKINTEEISQKREELKEVRQKEYRQGASSGPQRSPLTLEDLASRTATLMAATVLVFGGYFFSGTDSANSAFAALANRASHVRTSLANITHTVATLPTAVATASSHTSTESNLFLEDTARIVYFFPYALRETFVALPSSVRSVVGDIHNFGRTRAYTVAHSPFITSPVETLLSSIESGLTEYYSLIQNVGDGLTSAPEHTTALIDFAGVNVYRLAESTTSGFVAMVEATTPYVSSGLAYSGSTVAGAFESSAELSAIAVAAPQTLMERLAENTRSAIARWLGLAPTIVVDNSPSQSQTVVENPTYITQQVTQPVVERTVERVVATSGVTLSTLEERLNQLENKLTSQIYAISGADESNTIRTIYQTISQTNKIDQLTGVSLTNATVSGLSGLTNADIPDDITVSGYLTSTTGVVTVAQGGTGTTTPSGFLYGDNAGNLNATTTIAQNVGVQASTHTPQATSSMQMQAVHSRLLVLVQATKSLKLRVECLSGEQPLAVEALVHGQHQPMISLSTQQTQQM